jgi:four helix bundle protein
MLHVYTVVLELIRQLRAIIGIIERKDRDLARQLRRASASVALNLAEGTYSRGKNRAVRYHTALGSARETWSCLEVAEAAGYIKTLEPVLIARLNQITGTLVRLVERSQ